MVEVVRVLAALGLGRLYCRASSCCGRDVAVCVVLGIGRDREVGLTGLGVVVVVVVVVVVDVVVVVVEETRPRVGGGVISTMSSTKAGVRERG